MIFLKVDITNQQLSVIKQHEIIKTYVVSTGKNGAGEVMNSGQTPRGWHIVRAKIGNNSPVNTVFVGRRPTGEIFSKELYLQYPDRDWILSRIFWLSGLEVGKNRLGNVDTMRRYIYIHGSPDHVLMGSPASKGCIRMRNQDVIELFNLIPVRTRVLLE